MRHHLPDKKAIARSFSRKAASYEANAKAQRHALERLIARLPAYPCGRGVWLDLGSGPGPFESLLPADERPARMVCLDIAPGALREIRALGFGWVNGLRGDIEALPLHARCCDRIVVASVLQWIADPVEVIRRCGCLLKPGGQLVFSVFLSEYLRELADVRRRVSGARLPIRLFEQAEFIATLEAAGFELLWEEHLQEVLHFSSAMGLIKDLTGAGATATAEPADHPVRLFELCKMYEERYRRAGGVPATSDILVGIAAPRDHGCRGTD